MVGYKTYFCVFCIALLPILAVAQNNTNSPYTRYGFGQLSDQNFGNSKAMGVLLMHCVILTMLMQ